MRAASRLLARAFAQDPFIAHFFASPWRRRRAMPSFFAAVLRELFGAGGVYAIEVDARLTGVAAWLPPGAKPGAARRVHARLLFPRALPLLLGAFEEAGRHHPAEPHWYLAFVGIEAAAQGRGLGAQLLAPVLGRGELCYLETPFAGTRAFYERLGFQESGLLYPVAGAPPIWTMTRRP